jgi:hypothetical protein
MFETLFGAETPLAVRVIIAAVVVFALIGLTAWLVRRFGADRLGAHGLRNRQPRLAVIDAAAVDGRRRLVLIRRDNVEHLLMIGGPTDVVIEPNIVRANAPGREAAPPRDTTINRPAADAPPARAPQLDDAPSRPLQPEPGPRVRPALPEETAQQWVPPAEPRGRPSDALAGLAADLSASRPPPQSSLARAAPHELPRQAAAPSPAMPAREPAAAQGPRPSADQNLAEMASRLEAALRRPGVAGTAAELRNVGVKPAPEATTAPVGPQPGNPPAPDADNKPGQQKSSYGNLEQEMASLLSRPPGKT